MVDFSPFSPAVSSEVQAWIKAGTCSSGTVPSEPKCARTVQCRSFWLFAAYHIWNIRTCQKCVGFNFTSCCLTYLASPRELNFGWNDMQGFKV